MKNKLLHLIKSLNKQYRIECSMEVNLKETHLYRITRKQYRRLRGAIWTIERIDNPNWHSLRSLYVGKRTILISDILHVEGLHFEIVD